MVPPVASGLRGCVGARGCAPTCGPVCVGCSGGSGAGPRGRRPPGARAGAGRGRSRRPSCGRRARAAAAAHFARRRVGAAEVEDGPVAQRRGPGRAAPAYTRLTCARSSGGAAASSATARSGALVAERGRRPAGPRRRRPAGRGRRCRAGACRRRRPATRSRAGGQRGDGDVLVDDDPQAVREVGAARRPRMTAGIRARPRCAAGPRARAASSCRGRRPRAPRARAAASGPLSAGHGDVVDRDERGVAQPQPAAAAAARGRTRNARRRAGGGRRGSEAAAGRGIRLRPSTRPAPDRLP